MGSDSGRRARRWRSRFWDDFSRSGNPFWVTVDIPVRNRSVSDDRLTIFLVAEAYIELDIFQFREILMRCMYSVIEATAPLPPEMAKARLLKTTKHVEDAKTKLVEKWKAAQDDVVA